MKTKLIVSALAAFILVTSARAEKFLVAFKAAEVSSDATGKITSSPDNTALELEDVASVQNPPVELRSLAYVFDTETNQLQVVRRSDGVVVAVRFEFRDGLRYTQPDGKREFRQHFVYKPGETTPVGSVAGYALIGRDAAGALTSYGWRATMQLGEPAGVDEDGPFPPSIVIGNFTLGQKFVIGM